MPHNLAEVVVDKGMDAVRNTVQVDGTDNQVGVGRTDREDKDGVVEVVLTSWVYELAMV